MTHAELIQVRADHLSGEVVSDCCSAEVYDDDGEIGMCSECGEWVGVHRSSDPDWQ